MQYAPMWHSVSIVMSSHASWRIELLSSALVSASAVHMVLLAVQEPASPLTGRLRALTQPSMPQLLRHAQLCCCPAACALRRRLPPALAPGRAGTTHVKSAPGCDSAHPHSWT